LDQLIDILRFLTAGCVILIVIILLRSRASSHQKLPVTVFTICVLGYLLVDWDPLREYSAFYFFLVLAISLPFAFWILSQSLFNDKFHMRRWLVLVWTGFILIQLTLFGITNEGLLGEQKDIIRAASISQHALPLLFVVLSIVQAARGRDADLIDARMRFRSTFILLTAGLIILTLLTEIAFQGVEVPKNLELSQKLFITGLAFFFASHRLTFRPGFFLNLKTSHPLTVPKPGVDNKILAKLIDLMDHQEHWRTEGLTIRQLSETMQVKEYKLRNTINQYLGFRNFNDYLHSYRIAEARRLLADPEKKDMTILEIAYDMGYRSVAPFNKAFKQITKLTPTDWRRSKLY
jgi:AraC-like DNA-binding protein